MIVPSGDVENGKIRENNWKEGKKWGTEKKGKQKKECKEGKWDYQLIEELRGDFLMWSCSIREDGKLEKKKDTFIARSECTSFGTWRQVPVQN